MKKLVKKYIALFVSALLLTGCGSTNISGQQIIDVNEAERTAKEQRTGERADNLRESLSKQIADIREEVKNSTDKGKSDLAEQKEVVESYSQSEKDSDTSKQPSVDDSSVPKGSYLFLTASGNFSDSELNEASYNFYKLSKLDKLGRVGPGYGRFSKSSLKSNGRADISGITPSGWQQAFYDQSVTGSDHEALYDRSHIIMEALSDDSTEENLFTGTRQCNLTMLIWEQQVVDFLYDNPGYSVFYKVTPDFHGDELVCRGVTIQAQSIEDNGEGLAFTVYCYNREQGVTIDYATGKSWLTNE